MVIFESPFPDAPPGHHALPRWKIPLSGERSFEEHQSGEIKINGHLMNADLPNIEVMRQDVGMVFQHFNLFPHMSILENCTLAPIKARKVSQVDTEAQAIQYLDKVHIGNQPSKYPGQLSGGQ